MDTLVKGIYAASVDNGVVCATLSSTSEEPKTAVSLNISDVDSNPVVLTVYLEREKIVDSLHLNVAADLAPVRSLVLNRTIPAGQTLTVVCEPYTAGSQGTLTAWLEYSIGTA